VFNEYENDDDGLFFNFDIVEELAEAYANATKEGGQKLVMNDEPVLADPELQQSVEEHMDNLLDWSRVYQRDKIFSKIDDSSAQSYDSQGFLKDQFVIRMRSISEVVNGRAAFDPDSYVDGNIGIYVDTIEDNVAAGGEIASGEYRIYSACGKSGQYQPPVSLVYDTSIKIIDGEINPRYQSLSLSDSTTWGFEVRTKVGYGSLEKRAFLLKYGALTGVNRFSPDTVVQEYLNNIFDTAALDVYNTVITKEYVPKLMKQERNTISSLLNTSIGTELDPLATTIFNTTTTYEEEI